MGSPEPEDDAERLEKATAVAREVLSEVRGVTKDLHTAMREARNLSAKLTEEEMRREVKIAVDKLGEATDKAMRDSVEKVYAEFDKLMDLLMGRTKRDKAQGKRDISSLIEVAVKTEEP